MIDFSELSQEIFQVLRAYGKNIVLYDIDGNRAFEPEDARRFYITGDNILVSIVEDDENSAVKMYLSANIEVSQVLELLNTVRRIATQFNVLFNVRRHNKQIEPRDFSTQSSVSEQKEYSKMNIMEGMYGTSKSSYLKLENARMIVRHSDRVKEHVIGGRGRSIQSIFVENAVGERFLFPVNVLSGARAMTQHVNQGGNFADAVGQQIIRMAQDFSNLATASNHIAAHQRSLGDEAASLRSAVRESMASQRRVFERLYRDTGSYVRESARITEAEAIVESPENFSETLEAIRSMVAVEGITLSDKVLESVARVMGDLKALAEDEFEEIEADAAEDLAEEEPEVGAAEQVDEAKDPWDYIHDPSQLNPKKPVDKSLDPKKAQSAFNRGFNGVFVFGGSDSTGVSDLYHPFFELGMEKATAVVKSVDKSQMPAARIKGRFGETKTNPAFLRALKQYTDAAWNEQDVQAMLVQTKLSQESVDEADEQDEKPAGGIIKPTQPTPPRAPSEPINGKDATQDDQDGEDDDDQDGNDKEITSNTDKQQGLAMNNKVISQFNDWMDSFDPDSMVAEDEVDVEEAEVPQTPVGDYEVYGVMGMKSKPFCKKFKSEDARAAWLEKQEGNVDVHGFRDPQ